MEWVIYPDLIQPPHSVRFPKYLLFFTRCLRNLSCSVELCWYIKHVYETAPFKCCEINLQLIWYKYFYFSPHYQAFVISHVYGFQSLRHADHIDT